jgi:DNA repair protein RecO (recombination protein O)
MNVLSSESIVLRQRDFKDRDRLVTFLTRDRGKLSGIAKGAKVITGRSVGAYEPFTRCILHYVDKPAGGLVQIRKCDPLPPFLFPVQDYGRYLHLTYYTELVDLSSVSPSDSEAYFELLASILQRTAEVPAGQLPLLRLEFELELLHVLGWQPEWKRCIACGKPIFLRKEAGIHPVRLAPHQFDAAGGGIRCPDCHLPRGRHLHDLSPGSLAEFADWRAARAVSGPSWRRDRPAGPAGGAAEELAERAPSPAAVAELERAVTAHLLHHLERKPRSLDLLEADAKESAVTAASDGSR